MTGQKEQAVRELSDRIRDADPARGVFRSRLIGGLALIDLLSGDLPRARADARRLLEVARESRLRNTEGWAWYMSACTHLHALDLVEAAARGLAEDRVEGLEDGAGVGMGRVV